MIAHPRHHQGRDGSPIKKNKYYTFYRQSRKSRDGVVEARSRKKTYTERRPCRTAKRGTVVMSYLYIRWYVLSFVFSFPWLTIWRVIRDSNFNRRFCYGHFLFSFLGLSNTRSIQTIPFLTSLIHNNIHHPVTYIYTHTHMVVIHRK